MFSLQEREAAVAAVVVFILGFAIGPGQSIKKVSLMFSSDYFKPDHILSDWFTGLKRLSEWILFPSQCVFSFNIYAEQYKRIIDTYISFLKSEDCPRNSKYLAEWDVYKATATQTAKKEENAHIGLTENTIKTRYNLKYLSL